VKPATLARLSLIGSRTDALRVVFTVLSSALAAVTLLAAATVVAVPELGTSDDGSDAWNHFSSDLIAQPGLRPGVVVTLLLAAVPILALAGQSIRFGSPARDRRLAAMRLAGATPGQAVLIAAGETTASALLGSVVGLGVYFVLRWALNDRAPDGRLRLPTDVLPAPAAFVLILLIVPVLAGLAGAFLLRKVIITPLGVVRRTRDHKPSVLPGFLILAGVFAPFVIKPLGVWIYHRVGGVHAGTGVLTAGIVLLVVAAILGVVLGTGWIAYTAGRLLVRVGRRPATMLAGRQLMADPWSGSRTLAALLAAVVIGAGVYGYRVMLATQFRAEDAADRALNGAEFIPRETDFYFNTIKLVNLTVDIGVMVAAAGILIALADGIVARRRTYAALVATGVPRGTLGEAIAWQTLAPLIPATLVALIVGISLVRTTGSSATAEQGTCSGDDCAPGSPAWHSVKITLPVPVPYANLLLLGAEAVLAMAVVVTVGLVFLRMSTDLEELRVG
jgi:FtsX-like permease family protein